MNVHANPGTATLLLREDKDGIAMLTLNRPAARNSLSEDLIEALSTAFDAISRDSSIRVVILSANGAAFSAGHDLKETRRHGAPTLTAAKPISVTS